MQGDSQGTARLAVINGLRAIAILGVVWHHSVYKLWLAPAAPPHALLSALLDSGWLGVNLFFVLSGFVLYLPYARDRREINVAADWISFYKRRARRLLPLFYLSLFAFALLDLAGGKVLSSRELVLYLSGAYVFFTDTFFPAPNWVLWSLGVEIWFSILFPLLVLAIARYGITRVLIGCLLLSYAVRSAGVQGDLFAIGDRLTPIKDGILGRLDDFMVGMWLCDAYVRNRLKAAHAAPSLVCALVLGTLCAVLWEEVIDGNVSIQLVPLLHNGVQLTCGALLVAALTASDRWAIALTNRPLQLTGMMCFSIYVWHGRPIELILGPEFQWTSFVLYLAAITSISILSYKYIEYPNTSWRSAFAPIERKLSSFGVVN